MTHASSLDRNRWEDVPLITHALADQPEEVVIRYRADDYFALPDSGWGRWSAGRLARATWCGSSTPGNTPPS